MQFGTDEILYFGGIAVIMIALALFILSFVVMKLRRARLELRFQKEYGDPVPEEGDNTKSAAEKDS